MHDPLTVICSFRLPVLWRKHPWDKNKWFDDFIVFTLWHKDPCKLGNWRNDDSCGWFPRAGHGDPKVLEKIIKRFKSEWPSFFYDNGEPKLSTIGTAWNLFWATAAEMFGGYDGAKKYMSKRIADVIMFAENPSDSLADSITGKYLEDGEQTERRINERIENLAYIIYGYILRDVRPWWKHPRWHVHHWRFQFPWAQKIWRAFFKKCFKCNKRIGWTNNVIGDWDGVHIWHGECDETAKVKDGK